MPRRRTPRPRTARRRLVIIVVAAALVLLGGGGVLAWRLTRTDAATTTTQRTVAVSKETVKDTVGTTGTVEPARRADLTFSAAGTVTAVEVEVGDKVSKGDVLATLDDTDLQADLEAAQADLAAAQDDLTTAEADSTSTTAELNAAKAKVAVQKAAVSSATSALEAAQLRATFTGTVAAVDVAKGDTVGSSASAGSGSSGGSSSSGSGTTSGSTATSSTAAVTVISSDRYTVAASVGSADLARVKKGLQAQITTTGSTTTIFGTVSSVAVMASSGSSTSGTSGSATFDVTIDVTGSQKSLYAGASATVTILVSQRADVLTVPTAAVTTVGGKTVVNKLVDAKSVQTEVTLGQSYGATTEVTKGLAEGDQVVLSTAARVPGSGASQRGTSGGGGYAGGGGFPGAGTGGGFPAGGTGGAPAQGGTR